MKIFLCALSGATLGFGATFAAFPLLSDLIVGPVVSVDEMNRNVVLFLILASLLIVTGALMGGFYMRYRLNRVKNV